MSRRCHLCAIQMISFGSFLNGYRDHAGHLDSLSDNVRRQGHPEDRRRVWSWVRHGPEDQGGGLAKGGGEVERRTQAASTSRRQRLDVGANVHAAASTLAPV